MKRFFFGNVFIAAAVTTAAYWLTARFVPMPLMIVALTGASIGASALVAVIYAPLFAKSMKTPESRVAILSIGMGLVFASMIGKSLVSALYRITGNSDEIINHPLIGYLTLVGCVGMVLHVVAPGYPPIGFNERFGGRYRWFIAAVLIFGAASALLLTLTGVVLA